MHRISSKVWLAACLAAALAWIKLTHVGPVVWTLSERRGLGVHSGDAYGAVPLVLFLLARRFDKMKDMKTGIQDESKA